MPTANILDGLHTELDARVFDNPGKPEPKLKPHHRAWIEDRVHAILEKAGYEQVDSWLSLVLTGSLTTYQYSDESDVDISLFVDVDHFPEWSRAEMIGVMVQHMDGQTLPGTPHPMQCFVVPPGVSREDLYQPGLRSGYDLDTNEWIVPPDPAHAHDVEKEMNAAYVFALECADKIERLLRYEPNKAITYWHQLHKRRQRDQKAGKGDFSQSNIAYKMLNNRGLFPAISEASGEYIAKVAAGKQVAKWVYDPHGNHIVIGQMGNEEGENESHRQLFDRLGLDDEKTKDAQFGEFNKSGYNTTFGRPKIVGPGGGNYRAAWAAEEALRRLHGIKPKTENIGGWTLDDPKVTYTGEPPVVGENAEPESAWTFTTAVQKHRVDPLAVDKAGFHLELSKPVKVRSIDGGADLRYRSDLYDGNSHTVDVPSWISPESANEKIWHELVHAKQQEEGWKFHPNPETLPREEYLALPEEVDARERTPNPLPFPVALPPVTSIEGSSDDNDGSAPTWALTPTQEQQEINA